MSNTVILQDLGLIPYKDAWDFQEKLLKKKVEEKMTARAANTVIDVIDINNEDAAESHTPDYLLYAEHPPVYTLGKSGKQQHLLISEDLRREKGIEYFHINRGGDITFHGPQQLVGYPILDLDTFKPDLGWYLRSLEEVIILTLKEYGLQSERSAGETGVWLDAGIKGKERKICAMGIRCSRWVTMHGFALNVNTDLDFFNYIIPCGIMNKQVTSMQKELGYAVEMSEVKDVLRRKFEEVFEVEVKEAEV